ncbi:MAG: redoxin domain-containing protein [bacterium]
MTTGRIRTPSWLHLRVILLFLSLLSVAFPIVFVTSASGWADDPSALTPVDADRLHSMIEHSDAKLTLVNFWSTWCVPCREEMPALVQLQRKYSDRGLEVIFVSMDFHENAAAALDTLLAKGGSLPSYIKGQKDDPFIREIQPDWSGAIPASFLYDSTGTLIAWWNEALTLEQFERKVQPYLHSRR